MTWTKFWDMHSGGRSKEPYDQIYIEAPKDEAMSVFYSRFGHSPERTTCTCCGDDYSVYVEDTLEALTAFHRNCAAVWFDKDGNRMPADWEPRSLDRKHLYTTAHNKGYRQGYAEEPDPERTWAGPYIPLLDYLAREEILVIREHEIKPEERKVSVPQEGYVWVGGDD